jgi:hypothetical protein
VASGDHDVSTTDRVRLTKSQACLLAAAAMRDRSVELYDDPRTLRQFSNLTRRWHAGERAEVDDARGSRTDCANVRALLDGRAADAGLHALVDERVGHRVVVAAELDVVVDVDAGALPLP